jgi:hypothetical protein
MSIELRNANPLELLNSINYIDSALFGLSIDIFKIRLFMTAQQSAGLLKLGFEDGYADLCLEFRIIRNLTINLNKGMFAPPYLDDGDLSAVNLLHFDFSRLELKKIGYTGDTNRSGEYKRRDLHEIRFVFTTGTLQFQFADLEISTFEPSDLDSSYALNPGRA